MKDFILPDYTKCNLNISSTLAEFLGAPNNNPTLPLLKDELDKNYKNVIFICFDGLGIHPINTTLHETDILRQNIKSTLVSTFPSTTTNATTSLLFNKYPLEHGWFGWSLYFDHIDKCVDIFTSRDSYTGEYVACNPSPLAVFDYYFDNSTNEYGINTVLPPYVATAHPERNTVAKNLNELGDAIKCICRKNGKQFAYVYCDEPDHTMHNHGVSGKKSARIIKRISEKVRELYESSDDTMFIITADHGQIDIEGYVELYNDRELMDMLKVPPFMEARAPAFVVKEGKEKAFEEHFTKNYGEDFILFSSKELIEKGFLGPCGDKAHLLGDYIAIGTYTHKQMLFDAEQTRFRGHHTSLTEEMEVPLIILSKK